MKLLRWVSADGTVSDRPLSHTIKELRETLLFLCKNDHVRSRVIGRVLVAAAHGRYEQMVSFLANVSLRNRNILCEALKKHGLGLWDPTTNTKLNI